MAETFDLALVQGEHFRVGFRYLPDGETPQILTSWTWKSQARQREAVDAELILDLTSFITLDSGDHQTLWLDLPATTTFGLASISKRASYDLFVWPTGTPADKVLLAQGSVTLDPATTDLA